MIAERSRFLGSGASKVFSECRYYVPRKHLLRLDTLPALQAAEVGDDGQFADAALGFQIPNLRDDLVRCADKSDLLLDDLFVRELRQLLEGTTRIKAIALCH